MENKSDDCLSPFKKAEISNLDSGHWVRILSNCAHCTLMQAKRFSIHTFRHL